jgi:homoserine kinase
LGAVRARAPASAANLGPGFDTLALALQLHVEVEVEEAPHFQISTEGEGAGLAADATHLAARVATEVVGHDRLSLTVRSAIPLGRGLGSSAALAAAAAAAAGSSDPLSVAFRSDGHPENAAASVLGGLVTAAVVESRAVAQPMALDPRLVCVVLVPDRVLPTEDARRLLSEEVPRADATFNLGRMGLLLAGLADRRRLISHATEDRLHQDARGVLFPEAAGLLAGLRDAGALASCWSGAGSGLLGFCDQSDGPQLREAGNVLLGQAGVGGRALLLRPDRQGLVVTRR